MRVPEGGSPGSLPLRLTAAFPKPGSLSRAVVSFFVGLVLVGKGAGRAGMTLEAAADGQGPAPCCRGAKFPGGSPSHPFRQVMAGDRQTFFRPGRSRYRFSLIFFRGRGGPRLLLFPFNREFFRLAALVQVPLRRFYIAEFLALRSFKASHLSVAVGQAVVDARGPAPADGVYSLFVYFLTGQPAAGFGYGFEFSSFGSGEPVQLGLVLADVIINTGCVTHTHRVDRCHNLSSWLRFSFEILCLSFDFSSASPVVSAVPSAIRIHSPRFLQ